MSAASTAALVEPDAGASGTDDEAVWRALANPLRRRLLDQLRERPLTTGELAEGVPELSRFAVMQHLDVLTRAGLVVVRRRGRHRFNHLNAVPLRSWYERWVVPLADSAAAEILQLQRHLDQEEDDSMSTTRVEQLRTVRVENELRFRASPERLFQALTTDTLAWFPHTYGGDRVRALVFEARVGGLHYEDWGDGAGHIYAQVTEFDPPRRISTRGRLMPGTTLDSEYDLAIEDGQTVLRASKVAVGPLTDEEASSIQRYGDLQQFEDALRRVVELRAEEKQP